MTSEARRLTRTEWTYIIVGSVVVGLIFATILVSAIYHSPVWISVMKNYNMWKHFFGW